MIYQIKADRVHGESLSYMEKVCGFNRPGTRSIPMRNQCEKLWMEYLHGKEILIEILPVGKEIVQEKMLCLGDNKMKMDIFHLVDEEKILGGYLYLFHVPDVPELTDDLLGSYYLDTWQTSLVDSVRFWIKDTLQKKVDRDRELFGTDVCVTDGIGPGFFGLPIESVSLFMAQMHPEKVGIRLLSDGIMTPAKSVIGVHLCVQGNVPSLLGDCQHCMAKGKHCENCMFQKMLSGSVSS